MIRVGVNGYGVIGRRVAYAISKQNDMELVGIAKPDPDYKAKLAIKRGFDIYASCDADRVASFDSKGVKIRGMLSDLIEKVDIMVDCTPEGVGAKNQKIYDKAGIKAIWQGGEEHSISNFSFNAYVNYSSAINAKYSRIVSCNTTGLIRTLNALNNAFGVKSVNAFLVRRAADPVEIKKGPINAIEIEKDMPSHHGDDVKTVLSNMDIHTVAAKASTTLMHLHDINVELKKNITKDEVIDTFRKYRRIMLVSAEDGITSTAHVMDIARELGRGHGDMYEIAVWKEMFVNDRRLQYFQAIHQESDVVPENIDAIRAMCNIETDAEKSINKTDISLGIGVSL